MIQNGDTIKVNYKGTLEDGTVFDQSKEPLQFTVGSGQLIKGFDTAVIGMKKAEKKTITLKPEEAYGQPNDQYKKTFPNQGLPEGAKEGAMIALNGPQGQPIPGKIIKLDEKEVTIDFNHPLAGKTLTFEIEIVEEAN